MKPKDVAFLLFKKDLTKTQEGIMNDILLGTKRVIILAMTRYGKSMLISMSILLYAMYNSNKKIILISSTYKQARILMEYISGFIVNSDIVTKYVDLETTGISRLKKEVTKERITFKNGSEIRILSAEGKGERLMGFGADVVVEDESALISDEVYRLRITRMLGDNPDSIYISIGNPFPGNHFEENYKNSDWKKYKIDYKTALKEGRTTGQWIEEQRRILTPMEFAILYEAEFPEESEDALFRWAWINLAKERKFEDFEVNKKYLGCDIAEAGVDWTVITSIIETKDKKYIVTDIKNWHKSDTMVTAGYITKVDDKFKSDIIKVDAIGVGKGVYDRLKELKKPVIPIKVGMTATRESERFLNQKSQFYWKLRTLFEEGRISIPSNHNLINELRKMKYELTSAGKIKIIDPNKSPDFADSLMLGCANAKTGMVLV